MNSFNLPAPARAALVPAFSALVLLSAQAFGQTYYAANLVLKTAVQVPTSTGSTIVVTTRNQKTLINLAQGQLLNAKVGKDTVLALRLDGCEQPQAQLVVYDKAAAQEVVDITEPFVFPLTEPLAKVRSGETLGVRLPAEADFSPGGTAGSSINGGKMTISLATVRSPRAADECPDSISGSMLGHLNVTFTDSVGTVSGNALILNGSSLVARRIK